MEIPYTVDERPDTGVYNAKLGVWLFLASEVMLFGGLFSAYVFLRLGAPVGAFHEWGLELNVPLATLNTMILISSSMTMVMSWASLKMNDFKKYKLYMALTGLHGLHIIGGMIVLFYLWLPGSNMWDTKPEQFTNRVEIVGLYWHFVDLVWIFLFPILYLL